MYKITNLNRYLAIAGLYPGDTKSVSTLTDEIKYLRSKGYLKVEEVIQSKTKTEKVIKEDIKQQSEGEE